MRLRILSFITESSKNNVNTMEVQRLVDLSKISLLFLLTASGVSQVFFFWALWCLFIKHYDWPHNCTNSNHWKKFKSFFCCVRDNDYESTKPLDPFDDDVENEVFEPSSIVVVYQHKKKKISTSGQMESYFMEQDELTNTPLQGERLCHYIVCFAIALILLIITASLFLVAQYAEARKDVLTETSFKWESVAVASEIYSLFRSLVSCFIFSKLMYGIQRKCEELEMFVLYVDDNYNKLPQERDNEQPQERDNEQLQERNNAEQPQERNNAEQPQERNNVYKYVNNLFEEILQDDHRQNMSVYYRIGDTDISFVDRDNTRIANSCEYINKKINKEKEETLKNEKALAFKYLDERDKHFVKKAVVTLNWLQLWFLLHWLLHIISTFMIIALLIDAVTLHVKAKIPHANRGAKIYPEEISSLFMSSLMQCFFLFYPCLRAASVTRTRQRVIREISENIRLFGNIPPEVLNEFIESMKRRRFGFRLRIFCAKMQFNMNIAYLSIGFGFVGVVLSLILN